MFDHVVYENQKPINFNQIKECFDPNEWDVGYLSESGFRETSSKPIKCKFHFRGKDITEGKSQLWNGIILIKKSEVSNDYSVYTDSERILSSRFPKSPFIFTYTNFKEAALLAGVGQRARNSLIYNRKFGFQCKFCAYMCVEEIVNYPQVELNNKLLDLCEDCDDCIQNCPAKAISNDGIDFNKCEEFIGLSNDERYSSYKWFWYNKMKPNITRKEVASWNKSGDFKPVWGQGIDGYYEVKDGILCRDGTPIEVPYCRECQCQPKCSKLPLNSL